MKIDLNYLKKLLEACRASEAPTFDIDDLRAVGFDYHNDSLFEFHMKLFVDQGFVQRDDGDPGFGLTKGADRSASWAALPLRLTDSGHQFIEALANKQIWATINHNLKDTSIETIKTVAHLAGKPR